MQANGAADTSAGLPLMFAQNSVSMHDLGGPTWSDANIGPQHAACQLCLQPQAVMM